jgi:AP-1-like factor
LENKVKDLEKASEDANHENELLRARIDKMTSELNDYKKRVSMMPNGQPPLAAAVSKPAFGQAFLNNINDVNFQFEFPKFGGPLPGPTTTQVEAPKRSFSGSDPIKRAGAESLSPFTNSIDGLSPGNSSTYSQVGLDPLAKEDLAALSANLFSPSLSNKLSPSTRGGSVDSHLSFGGAASTSSPSNSSNSNMGGPSSSCGTSPEPFTQSPMGFKPVDTLTTIGEEQPGLINSAQGKDNLSASN